MSELVSVVVTTYNRVNDLLNIVRKLTSQDYGNIEIIVVNDGSTDDTATALGAISDRRLKVTNKPNGGVSSARNAGIEAACGKYIMFIDDDDDIPSDFVQAFLNPEYADFDLVVDSYCNQLDDNEPYPINFETAEFKTSVDTLDWLFGHMPDRPYAFFAHGKRYKLSIIKENSIRFSERIRFVEDRPFVVDYILASRTCRFINNHKYIVKSQTLSEYRLSKGLKQSDYLWNNILDSYKYLLSVYKSCGVKSVRSYADNYLATRSLDYLYSPFCSGLYSTEKDHRNVYNMITVVSETVSQINVCRYDAKLYILLIKIFGKQSVKLWKSFTYAKRLIKEVIKSLVSLKKC